MNKYVYSFLGTYFRGIAIGLADLVPGVSGGTIAFITGIYDKIIATIKIGSSLVPYLILLKGEIKTFWKVINGNFLIGLLLGVITAIIIAADFIHYMLVEQTEIILGFFMGLTIAAIIWIGRGIKYSIKVFVFAVIGYLFALVLVLVNPITLSTEPNLQAYFLAGAITLCVMILPGISGSFVLLIIGIYPYLIEAVINRDILIMFVFAGGGIIGLALFARLLNKLLNHFRNETIVFLVAIMLGALPKLWPWKEAGEGVRVILQDNVLPTELIEPNYILVILFFIFGLASVFVVEVAATRIRQTQMRGT